MITAWQISSTMDKMQQFIRFIQQFDYQRQKLQRLLPVITRIKRISYQKQSINKQLLQLQQSNLLTYSSATNDNNTTTSKKIQQNYNNTLIQSTTNLNNKLTSISHDISKQQDEHTKQIRKLMKQSDNKLNIQEKQLQLRREQLLKQLDHQVIRSSQLKGIDGVINNEQYEQQKRQLLSSSPQLLGSTPPNDNNINSNIYTKHIDQHISSLSLINHTILNNDDNNSTYNITQPIYTRQLYELKCKLASLEDRRRKLTVNRLFHSIDSNNNNNFMNKYQYQQKQQQQVQQSNSKNEAVQQQQYQPQDRQRSQQNHNNNNKGFLNSIMAMFSSSSSTTNQSNQNTTSHKKDNNTKDNKSKSKQKSFLQKQNTNSIKQLPNKQNNLIQSHHPLPSLHDIDDIEVRLKLSQIIAQIYQFRQDINVMVQENLVMRLNRMVSNLELVNKEINCYQQELIKVGRVVRQQMMLGNIKNNNKSNNINKNNIITLLKQNPQLQFFTQFINKNISHRQKILHSIFTRILPSIPSITTFLTNRLKQLTTISQQFELTNRNKYSMKLKATKSKRQFEILTKQMEGIKGYLQKSVLVRIRQVESLLIEGLRMYGEQIRDFQMMVGCKVVQQQQQQIQQQQQQQIQQLLQLLLKTNNQHLITTVQQQLTINSLLQKICAQQQQLQNTYKNNNTNEQQQFYYNRMRLFYQKLSTTYQCLDYIIIAV